VPTLPGAGVSLPAHEPEEGEGDDDGDYEAAAAGADLVDAGVHFLHEIVVFVAHGHVLIGPELPCKGGKVNTETEDKVRSTEYGGKVGAGFCRALVMSRRSRRSLAPT